tara:strand:- start:156 stop:743 length:588 start_codon:yes stop_codon:yes gene_type:complete
MKKGIKKSAVQRMRNLVTGDYTSKTLAQSGYSKKSNSKKSEGDIWEERGKEWTIKNGIKQTITKLDAAREYAKIPTHCPKCDAKMNKPQHKFTYRRFKHCLLCQTNEEFEMRETGTYEAWKNKQISINFEKWLYGAKEEFKEWLKTRKAKHAITESGDIEDWSGGQTDEALIEQFDIYIEQEQQKLKDMISEKQE